MYLDISEHGGTVVVQLANYGAVTIDWVTSGRNMSTYQVVRLYGASTDE